MPVPFYGFHLTLPFTSSVLEVNHSGSMEVVVLCEMCISYVLCLVGKAACIKTVTVNLTNVAASSYECGEEFNHTGLLKRFQFY